MQPFNVLQVFAITAGGVFTLVVLRCFIFSLWSYYFKFWFYKCLYYPFIIRRHRAFGPVTWLRMILELGSWIAVAVLVSIGVRSARELGASLGAFALIFFVPLVFGGDLTFASRMLDAPIRVLRRAHASLGMLALMLILVHSILSGSQRGFFSFSDPVWLYGIVVRQASGSF